MTLQISGKSRPYGILSNGVLPIRRGKTFYPSVDHFMMASMLKKTSDQSNVLSYPDLYQAKIVYNQLDDAQYRRLLETSCLAFYKKACKDTTLVQGKTMGSQIRSLLRSQSHYQFQPTKDLSNLSMLLGLIEGRGYNILGHSLETLHHTLKDTKDDVPLGLEYLFWKMEGKQPDKTNHFRMVNKAEMNPVLEDPKMKKAIVQAFAETLNEDEEWIDAEEGGVGDEEEADDQEAGGTGEAVDLLEDNYPAPPTTYRQRRQRPERLHFWEGVSKDVLDTEEEGLEKRTNPLEVFKIMKVAEYLTGLMNSGIDISSFFDKTVHQIFFDYRIFPEILSLSPESKRYIYKDCWDMFQAGTLPFYHLVRMEILYPSTTLNNLVGFIRKEKIKDLNGNIGYRVQQILFRSFLEQTLKKNYPDIDPVMIPLTLHRESQRFSMDEFQTITNHLYHLYFKGTFKVSEEDAVMIRFFESHRKTQEEIEEGLRFIPMVSSREDSLKVEDHELLDPKRKRNVRLHNKTFHDLYQYVYFQLFKFFGDVSDEKAYQELHQGDQLLPGDHPLLPERLHFLVQTRRQQLLDEALSIKFNSYSQIREMLVFLKTTNQSLRFEDPMDVDTARGWSQQATKIPPREEDLMKIILGWTRKDFEKSVFLYSFLLEFFSVLDLFKTLQGKRLTGEILQLFFSCFYKNLLVIQKYFQKTPPSCPDVFSDWIEKQKVVSSSDISRLWAILYPYIHNFTLESFHPGNMFQKSKEGLKDLTQEKKELKVVRAFVKLVNCVVSKEQPLSTPELYTLVQIFTGRHRLTPWHDPAYEFVVEEEKDNLPPLAHLLPKEIKDKLPFGKKKKAEKRVFRHDLIHPRVHHLLPYIETELKRNFKEDISQMSFALASVLTNTKNLRRAQFFLA